MPKDQVKEAREKLMDPDSGRFYKQMKGLNSVVFRDGFVYACNKQHESTVTDLAVWKLIQWSSQWNFYIPREIGCNL